MPEQQDKVKVVAWEAIGSRGLVVGVADSMLMRDKALAKGHHVAGLVRQSDHLTEVARLRAESEALAESLMGIRDAVNFEAACITAREFDKRVFATEAKWKAIDAASAALTAYEASKESSNGNG